MMNAYEILIHTELLNWQNKMLRRPSIFNNLSKKIQTKINSWIPEKIHKAITLTIKQMIRAVLFGSEYTTSSILLNISLQEREEAVLRKIDIYKNTAAVEGGIIGAGGILLGFAEFPILIGIKLKLLFEIAALYGFNVADYKERIYLLNIFELTFSSDENRKKVYLKIADWEKKVKSCRKIFISLTGELFSRSTEIILTLQKWRSLSP